MLRKKWLFLNVIAFLMLVFSPLYAQINQNQQSDSNQQNLMQPLQNKVGQVTQTIHDTVMQVAPDSAKQKYLDTLHEQYQKQLNSITPAATSTYQQAKQTVTNCLQGNCQVSISLPAMNKKSITDSIQMLHDQIYSTRIFSTTISIIAIVIVFIILLIWVMTWLVYKVRKNQAQTRVNETREQAFQEIAGEDVNATKLDLARAYIEMHEMDNARVLLEEVAQKGNLQQQDEAKQLLQEL